MSMMSRGLIRLANLEVMVLCAQEDNEEKVEFIIFIFNPFERLCREKNKTIREL